MEQANKRKLVSIRTIANIEPILNADAIEVAVVDGWKVVTKKNEFKPGDLCVYFEIDSFLPDGVPAWQFLVDKSARMFEGVKGHKLRSIKLRGVVSQGLVLPIDFAVERFEGSEFDEGQELGEFFAVGSDISEFLGVKKWEAALPAELVGQAQGLFPSFIRKTDQERCQNLIAEIFGYEDKVIPFEVAGIPAEALADMVIKGQVVMTAEGPKKILPAKADRNAQYEVSMKLDGSSLTGFARAQFTEPFLDEFGELQNPIESGVCSRNLQLKVNDENAQNAFVKMFVESGLKVALETLAAEGLEIAVQGELVGPGIQGNQENFKTPQFFVFDIFNIKSGQYMGPAERMETFKKLLELGAKINHVPVLHAAATLDELGLKSVSDLLQFAEGPSIAAKQREGLVFKRLDGGFSFKAISQKWLLAEKD